MRRYAACQYFLRQINTHAEKFTDVQRSTTPPIFANRPGNEQREANPNDVFSMRATWPFHFAGDSGASLFGQRAWLSWRFLALLELPKLQIWELPMQSTQLQNLIQSTRSSACSVASLDAQAVLRILLEFLNDPRDNNAKARWLRQAMATRGVKLDAQSITQSLGTAVEDCFAMLQSKLIQNVHSASVELSARYVATVALFLYLQSLHRNQEFGRWQAWTLQELSAASSSGKPKPYVTADMLGSDNSSPLSTFPSVYANMSLNLDPKIHPIASPPVICWQCGAGFLSQQDVARHTQAEHGGYAEYRKHLLWLAGKKKRVCASPPMAQAPHARELFFPPMLLHPREWRHRVDGRQKH